MKKKCLPKTCPRILVIGLLLFFLSISFSVFAQNEETKIAYINQSRLRNEFKDYQKSIKDIKDTWHKTMQSYQGDIQKSDSAYQSQIKRDSTSTNDKDGILQYENERNALKDNYKNKLDEIVQQRRSNMDTYEQRIIKAVEEAILQGTFVEVRNRYKNTNVADGQDITDQILKKLNN